MLERTLLVRAEGDAMTDATLIAARQYSELGLGVIPVKPMSKLPDLSRWQQYQKRRPTEDEVRDWFSRDRNIGIVCGEISGGLVVLDFDDSRAFAYCFPDRAELAGRTKIAETGKGVHVYARVKGGGRPKSTTYAKRNAAQKTWLPVDVKGEGGFVVAPPSVHPSGKPYRFEGDANGILELASEDRLHDDLRKRSEEWPLIETLAPSWSTEGTRHNLALGLAALGAKRLGWDEDRGKDVVRRACAALGDTEIADRLKAVETTYANVAAGKEVAWSTYLGPELTAQLERLIPKRRKSAAREGEREPAEHVRYVVDLMGRFTFATMNDTDEVFVYDGGVYRKGAESLIRAEVEMQLFEEEDSAKTKLTDETVDAIRRRTYTKRETFNLLGKLCLLNGVLDLAVLVVQPHSSNDRFTIQLTVAYDPGATCPRFETFLEQVVPDSMDRETLQRMAGYCLERGNPYQVAFMLVGIGDNGKSTFLRVLAEMLGKENVASEPLQILSENRFAAAHLWDKLANICADIPATGIKSTGTFKMLTGGDLVRGEQKFREAFYFENPAKLIFSANVLPDVNDKTVAFWRRWGPGLVRFPVNVNALPEGKDPDLLAKLTAELSGILNWSLVGLRRLREARGFPKREGDLEREWRQRADSLYWFASECVEVEMGEYTPKDDFYEAYATFAEDRGVTVKKPETIGKELPGLIPQVRSEHPRIGKDGKQVRVWANLILTPLADPVALGPPVADGQKRPPLSAFATGETGATGVTNYVPRDQHPDFMTGLGRALEVRRYDPKRPVNFIVEDLRKELRDRGHEPDVDQLTAGVIRGMMPEGPR